MIVKTEFQSFRQILYHSGWFYKAITRRLYDQDLIILYNIMYHIYSKHVDLINLAKKYSNKIVVCDPYIIKPKEISAHDKLLKIVIFIGKRLPKPLFKIVDFLLLDNDGINSYQIRLQLNLNKKSLKIFFKTMGFKIKYKISDEHIAIWESPDIMEVET